MKTIQQAIKNNPGKVFLLLLALYGIAGQSDYESEISEGKSWGQVIAESDAEKARQSRSARQ